MLKKKIIKNRVGCRIKVTGNYLYAPHCELGEHCLHIYLIKWKQC